MTKRISSILILLTVSLVFCASGLAQSQSQYALIRRQVTKNPDIWKMTKSEAWEHLNVQLIVNSVSAAQSYVMTPWYELWSGMAFELDNGWNRMLYSECLDNWIRAYGTLGSGTGQFS